MDTARLLKRVDEIVAKNEAAERSRSGQWNYANSALVQDFRSSGLSFLRETFGTNHPYYQEFDRLAIATDGLNDGKGILRAVRDEINGGWLDSVRGLLTAEVFGDFLDMAAHLLEQEYKDAAAVIIGSTLEGHLRQLAAKHKVETETIRDDVPVPRKAESLNADLSKVAYEKQDNKNVTAWLNLRNDAAHGHYTKYQIEQVRIMLAGVRDFMTRNPA